MLVSVFFGEGVPHHVAGVIMTELCDIHCMMGMFHWTKMVLKCAGQYV